MWFLKATTIAAFIFLSLTGNMTAKIAEPTPGLYREILTSFVEHNQQGKKTDVTKERQASNTDSFCMTAEQAKNFFHPKGMESCNFKLTQLANGLFETRGTCPSGWSIKAVNRVTPQRITNEVWFTFPDGSGAYKRSVSKRIGDCLTSSKEIGQ